MNFQPEESVWILIDDEVIAARFVAYLPDGQARVRYSDLTLKGHRETRAAHVFREYKQAKDFIKWRDSITVGEWKTYLQNLDRESSTGSASSSSGPSSPPSSDLSLEDSTEVCGV